MMPRCCSSSRARTSGTALTGETAPLTVVAADLGGDVDAVDVDRRARGSVPDSIAGSGPGGHGAGSCTSTPSRSIHQVIARNIAPVSR